MRLMTIIAALLLPTLAAAAEPVQIKPQIGDTYEITSGRESSQRSNDGSSRRPRIETQIVKDVMERRRVSKPAPDWSRTA
ncbi:MAG: hypothetical protein ABI810_18640 [Sphingomonas bacterium]